MSKLISFFVLLSVTCFQSFSIAAQERIKTWNFRPECFPYTFEITNVSMGLQYFEDLDLDGIEEKITVNPISEKHSPAFVIVNSLLNNDVHTHYYHDSRVVIQRDLQFLNLNQHSNKEIVIPYSIKDSLFIDVVDNHGTRLVHFFHSRHPRRVVDGDSVDWAPALLFADLCDLDGDRTSELITVFRGGFNRQPRGVFVHRFPQGGLIDSCLIGPEPGTMFMSDFDRDGQYEMIMHTTAPANGASGHGLTDRIPYVLYFKFTPQPVLVDSIRLGNITYTRSDFFFIDFVGDSSKEFVAVRRSTDTGLLTRIVVVDPRNFDIMNDQTFAFKSKSVVPFYLTENNQARLLFYDEENHLILIDHTLQAVWRHKWPISSDRLAPGADIDGDGVPETIIRGNLHSVLVNQHLNIMAVWPEKAGGIRKTIKLPGENQPILITRDSEEVRFYRVRRNPRYLFYRHWIPAVSFISFTFVLLIILFALKEHAGHKTINRFLEHLVESDTRAIAIVDKNLRIITSNQQLFDWFNLQRNPKRKTLLDEDLNGYPLIAEALREWRDGYTHIRREKLLSLQTANGQRTILLIFEPVPRTLMTRRVIQVSFVDQSIQAELEKIRSWTHMAQRVAHDLKNPLGTIQMILQKLRTLVTKENQEMHAALFPYFDKIESRIESLRKMTRNFLKFVNIEAPHFIVINLNDFLRQTLDTITATLPPDIELRRELSDEVTPVEIDVEQMASVVENLIANAIDAMPKGGNISVSSRVAQRLQFIGYDDRPRDYALIEVRDTGMGMPADVLDHLFEPHFSYSKESSGLGLAMVKKIIDDHRGQTEVESEIDVGSLFTLYLPIRISMP